MFSKVKSLRMKQGITQQAFINDTDIHIGRIELGMLNVSISTIAEIYRYFWITIEKLFKDIEL